jgi:3-oxoacyl-[acyl-carrier-protein] synthase-1
VIFSTMKSKTLTGILSNNIVSPLGFTTEENWQALSAGRSELRCYEHGFDLPEPFCASLLDCDSLDEKCNKLISKDIEKYTKVEKMAILSAADAIVRAGIDPASPEVVFVLSTTKGNVELLQDSRGFAPERAYLWSSAQQVARFFGNPNEPVVVSNACISGCAALVVAQRMLAARRCRYAVVVGADVLSKFVISGFQSFKALSPVLCRPFDGERIGLNLGEAAATVVCARCEDAEGKAGSWLLGGGLCNDANHISAPSRTAEGLVRAFRQAASDLTEEAMQEVAFINAHGTATRYNDDMESVAINRLGLSQVPVNSLKGYFGHTLGAAGVLEVIVSSVELDEGKVLPTRGCITPGTVEQINVCQEITTTNKNLFVKLISGFGGSNAALILAKNGDCMLSFIPAENL